MSSPIAAERFGSINNFALVVFAPLKFFWFMDRPTGSGIVPRCFSSALGNSESRKASAILMRPSANRCSFPMTTLGWEFAIFLALFKRASAICEWSKNRQFIFGYFYNESVASISIFAPNGFQHHIQTVILLQLLSKNNTKQITAVSQTEKYQTLTFV